MPTRTPEQTRSKSLSLRSSPEYIIEGDGRVAGVGSWVRLCAWKSGAAAPTCPAKRALQTNLSRLRIVEEARRLPKARLVPAVGELGW
jgi:hypothetical protein